MVKWNIHSYRILYVDGEMEHTQLLHIIPYYGLLLCWVLNTVNKDCEAIVAWVVSVCVTRLIYYITQPNNTALWLADILQYTHVISKGRSLRWVEINQYDITMSTHDITMGNDFATDVHCEITMVMMLLGIAIVMSHWVMTATYHGITMYNDVAMNIF